MEIKYENLCVTGKEIFRASSGLYENHKRNPGYDYFRQVAVNEKNKLRKHVAMCEGCKG